MYEWFKASLFSNIIVIDTCKNYPQILKILGEKFWWKLAYLHNLTLYSHEPQYNSNKQLIAKGIMTTF